MLEFSLENILVEVNIEDVEKMVRSDKFAQFLLSNTTEFESAAFILQVLLNAIDAMKSQD